MNSKQKQIHKSTFSGGQKTDLALSLVRSDTFEYSLNCNIDSSAEGNMGVVTNVKGTVQISFELPEGINRTIGTALDEESNKFYFAVYNSLGYNSWYQFDAVSETVIPVITSIEDTGGIDIFKWGPKDLILHADIKGDLLYWSMKGHPARKINIKKAIQKDDSGYGQVILDNYTRAYKRTADFPPEAKYETNLDVKSNHVYSYLFKFAVAFIYDDGERSVYSDFSTVAIPDEENTSGTLGIPLTNNLIKVSFLTGGMIVKKIELIAQKTNPEGGVTDWVSIITLDKDLLNIPDNSEYDYDFYNDNTYLQISQPEVLMPHSYLPRNPACQAIVGDAIAYSNFTEGFPGVNVDMTAQVTYEDLFVPDGTVNKLNEPSIIVNKIDEWYESGGFMSKGWRHYIGEVVIGPDVKKGNTFNVNILDGAKIDSKFSYDAKLTDNASTVANALASKFRTHARMSGKVGEKEGWVDVVSVDASGAAKFRFDIWNRAGKDYHKFSWSVNPVNYSTLKNTGNSVLTNKLGSSHRYGIIYEDEDQVNSLTYGNIDAVSIKNLNELGGLKKAIIVLNINHKAPSWAKSYSIARTRNLVQDKYIQMLIQSKVTVTNVSGETYSDLIIGSFNTYKDVHPNSTLLYEFKKGDRVRLQRVYDESTSSWSIPTNVIDYEVLAYYPEKKETVNKNVKIVANSNLVEVDGPDANNVGNNIVIRDSERTITGITSEGYQLDSPITLEVNSSEDQTLPSFQIINRRGVLRVKINPDYPIDVIPDSKYAMVEVYTPAQTLSNEENENYYKIGYKFPIIEENGLYLHAGNIENQTLTSPAKVQISGYDNYVRNRELPINNDSKNPQVIVSSIEDSSFSDFYVSDMSSYGKPSRMDNSSGEVYLDSRIRFSLNYIEDTKINGLSFFVNSNRVDYNDQYGAIMRLMSSNGRLYIFKYLKYCWAPIKGSLITDNNQTDILAYNSNILPPKHEYFLFDAGVGDNPESVVRYGNDVFSVSPNAGYILKLGGNGLLPVSKIFGIDKVAREIIANASKSGARMFGAYDRKNGKYIINVEGYDRVIFDNEINAQNYKPIAIDLEGAWEIITPPQHGQVVVTGGTYEYTPNLNFSGTDRISYRSGSGEIRNDLFNVLSVETATDWRGIEQYCVTDATGRTGFTGFSTLQEYDTITGDPTGNTKANIPSDPNYIENYYDVNLCPLGFGFVKVMDVDLSKNVQNISFKVESTTNFSLLIKRGTAFSGDILFDSGLRSSGEFTANLSQGSGSASVYIVKPDDDYSNVTLFKSAGAYITSASLNELPGIQTLILDQSSISASHLNNFSSLSVSACTSLKRLEVIKHELVSVDLTPNNLIEYIDLSFGRFLQGITIGSWPLIKELHVQECLFTSVGYNATPVNNLIVLMSDNARVSGNVLQYGLDSGQGVKPSTSVLPKYNSLIDAGVIVIGKDPVEVVEVNLSSTVVLGNPNEIDYTLILADNRTLSVPITVTLRLRYSTDSGSKVKLLYPVLEANNSQMTYRFESDEIITGGISTTITNVNPNPAGGVVVKY